MGENGKKRHREGNEESESASKRVRSEKNRSIFVRSLPQDATDETLTEFFSQHFPVKHATVVKDKDTKSSRGFGCK